MPRIPVRTEPYASPLRQHRHFKSKRDLILRSLGKSSYINGSQFIVLFISARGDVETYASELLQDVSSAVDPSLHGGPEGSRQEDSVWKWDVVERKRKLIKEVGERRRREVAEKRGLFGADAPEHDGDLDAELEAEGAEDDEDGDAERMDMESPSKSGARLVRATSSLMTCMNQAAVNQVDECVDGDETLVEDADEFLPAKDEAGGGLGPAITTVGWKKSQVSPRKVSPVCDGTSKTSDKRAADHNLFLPESKASSAFPTDPDASVPTVTPAKTRPRGFSAASQFKTPAHPSNRSATNPSTSVLASRVLQVGSSSRRPSHAGDGDLFLPSTPIRPPATSSPYGDPVNSSFAQQSSGDTPTAATNVLSIPVDSLETYYIERFNALQQTTCKLVVKTWIKVIEPKKQTRFPYNKGEASKPGWWPQGVRHREPDHLMKPERTQLLLAILRMPNVNPTKLELSTAEMLAYISQSKMRILREIYSVAKEEEKRKLNGGTGDLVVRLPASPSATLTGRLPVVTPDRAPPSLSTGEVSNDAESVADPLSSIRKRKAEPLEADAEANKENLVVHRTAESTVLPAVPGGAAQLQHIKRARANSTLGMYGHGQNPRAVDQMSPLRQIGGNTAPFSNSPLVHRPSTAHAQTYASVPTRQHQQGGWLGGSPQPNVFYPSASSTPILGSGWTITAQTDQSRSPAPSQSLADPTAVAYARAGPGPASASTMKKRSSSQRHAQPQHSRAPAGAVARLPLPSLALAPQVATERPAPTGGYYYPVPAPSSAVPLNNQSYWTVQQHHQDISYASPQAKPMSHMPYLMTTAPAAPFPPANAAMQYPGASATSGHTVPFYDTFSPMQPPNSAGGMTAESVFAFTPTIGGESQQDDGNANTDTEIQEEYVWTNDSQ